MITKNNKAKQTLSAIFLSTLSFSVGCVSSQYMYPTIPEVVVKKPVVNEKGFRQVFYASQKEGETYLEELATKDNREEAFVFVPSTSMWVEVGYRSEELSVLNDIITINSLQKLYGPVIHYHTHKRDSQLTPSAQDIAFIIDRSLEADRNMTKIYGAISSPFGTTKYMVLPKGIEYFSKSRDSYITKQNFVLKSASEKEKKIIIKDFWEEHLQHGLEIQKKINATTTSNISSLIEASNSQYIYTTFVPRGKTSHK